MNFRPKILFVTAHCPHGQAYGAQLRTLNMARILKRFGDLAMAIFPFEAIGDEALRRTKNEFEVRGVFHFTVKASGSIGARLKREIDPYCADTEGKRLSADDEAAFHRIADEYDVIWFQGISIPNCLGRKEWPCSVLDIDDVPSQFYKGKARESDGLRSKLMATRKYAQWKWRETVLLERFRIVGVCSDRDRKYLGGDERVHVIPNGFQSAESLPDVKPALPHRIGFIGTMKYAPNREGVRWFIDEVWSILRSRHPDVRLRLVGAATDQEAHDGEVNIDRLGFVEDSDSEIASWTLTIVPILVGGGTRIKIAEAFSRMCPVVSTRQGAYGYTVESGSECLLADTAAEFADACSSLIDDRSLAEGIATRAKAKFDRELSWDAIAPRVRGAIEACISQAPAVAAN